MLISDEVAVIGEEENIMTVNHPTTNLKEILYDEALKIAESVEDARELAEEAYSDFLHHHAIIA